MFIENANLKKSHQTATYIAFSMMLFPIFLGLLAEFFFKDMTLITEISFYPTLKIIAIALTVIEIVMVIILRNVLLADNNKFPHTPATPENNLAPNENQFIQRLFSSFIITYALCDSIAIYGFVLYIIGKDSSILIGFLGTALFLMVVQFPKYDEWENKLREYLNL